MFSYEQWEAIKWFQTGKLYDLIYVLKNYYGYYVQNDLENSWNGNGGELERLLQKCKREVTMTGVVTMSYFRGQKMQNVVMDCM